MGEDYLNLSAIAKNLGLDANDRLMIPKKNVLNGLKKSIDFHCESILPYAADLSGVSENSIRMKFLGATVDPGVKINAQVQLTTDGRFAVKVHAPLMNFVWQCAKLWSTRKGVMATQRHQGETTTVPLAETIDRTKHLLDAFWKGTICCYDVCPRTLLSRNQVNLAWLMMHLAERFVVGHEFGHAIIHLDSSGEPNCFIDLLKWTRRWAHFYSAEILDRLDNFRRSQEVIDWEVGDFEEHWGEEFAADILGANMALRSAHNVKDSVAGLWAIEELLVMFHMLESHYRNVVGYDLPLNSHPYSKLRLTVIRSATRDGCSAGVRGVWDTGRFFEQLGEEILANIRRKY